MKRSNLHIFGILLLALAGGCATATQPVITPTQVNYTQAATYTYNYNARDTSDNLITSGTDTITTTVAATNQIYQGMSNVTVLVNAHSNGSKPDTTYISQSDNNFWHYNYGLEAINNNPSILNIIGSPIQLGWVLQAQFNASAGDKWTAANDTNLIIKVTGAGAVPATVLVTSVEKNDTTITVNDTTVPAKHVFHTVTLTALGSPIVTTVDAYVAASVGVTLNIVHSADISIPGLYTGPVKGNQSLMVSHS